MRGDAVDVELGAFAPGLLARIHAVVAGMLEQHRVKDRFGAPTFVYQVSGNTRC
jgi:hypothetical protein